MRRFVFVGALVGALAAASAFGQTSSLSGASLGTVHLGKKMMADGKTLTPGTYQIRLTGDEPKPGVGQAPGAERYVEFVKGGKVVAREVATVIPAEEIGKVAKKTPPKPGTSKVEMLKGGNYWRVWINKSGTNYIINLPTAA